MRPSFTQPIPLNPDRASDKDDDAEVENGKACVVKAVMAGSGYDGPDWQPHIRNTSPDLLE